MTITLTEGDLQITVNNAEDARRFDGSNHGLSHCMKAVDFIIELSDSYLYIEFKDPYQPGSTQESRQEFIQRFESGVLDEDLKYKYRDSYLYEWASGRADKPVHYAVLVAAEDLSDDVFLMRTEDLKRKLPIIVPDSWTRPIVDACYVFNIPMWNHYLPELPVTRMSSGP